MRNHAKGTFNRLYAMVEVEDDKKHTVPGLSLDSIAVSVRFCIIS